MESWVKAQLDVLLPALAECSSVDEARIAQLCGDVIQALRSRGLGSMLSFKRPVRELRNAVKEQSGVQYEVALRYLDLSEQEKIAIAQPSEAKRDERLTNQSMIRHPDELVARMRELLISDEWYEVAAGLSLATGRRLAEVLRFAAFREKSLYSVLFSGQRKSKQADMEYEIPTLAPAREIVAAWQRLRSLRNFDETPSDQLSSSFGEPVKTTVIREFGRFIEATEGHAALYTHMLRAVYPRLCIRYFLPSHVNEVAFASEILGHVVNRNGELVPNISASLYYMSYKVLADDGTVDGSEGLWLNKPGVEVLEKFQIEKKEKKPMDAAAVEGRTKIGLDRSVKAEFDDAQKEMEAATANEAIRRLLAEHNVYKQIVALVGGADQIGALCAILSETAEIKLTDESVIDALQAAVSDKRRFRANYAQRSQNLAERDYTSMSFEELSKQRTPEASQEKWRRAVNDIIEFNTNASIPELRIYINAASVKQAVGGRGTEIKKYLETRQDEIEAHHQRYKLKASLNYGRDNIRERLYPGSTAPSEEE